MQEALTAEHAGDDLRSRVARLVVAPAFQHAVTGLILLNAVSASRPARPR
jgi:hypothetical protein